MTYVKLSLAKNLETKDRLKIETGSIGLWCRGWVVEEDAGSIGCIDTSA
jgi:hypothetical protein